MAILDFKALNPLLISIYERAISQKIPSPNGLPNFRGFEGPMKVLRANFSQHTLMEELHAS